MFEKLRSKWRQFYHAVQREGIIPAIRSAIIYVVRNPGRSVGISTSPYQTGQRIDLHERWNLIQDVLESSHQSVLDIGCNEGVLTRRTAESDRFAIGIDQSEIVLEEVERIEVYLEQVLPDPDVDYLGTTAYTGPKRCTL